MKKIKEKFYEIFKIKKRPEDKEKTIIVPVAVEEPEKTTKKQISEEGRILRNLLIGFGIIIIILFLIVLFVYSIRHFEYRGVKFNVVKEGDLIFYRTFFPLYYDNGEFRGDYSFFIRNDPRKLHDIPFNGELVLLKNMVINSTENFNCDGDGIIGVANLLNPLKILGVNVIKDENATCDDNGKYMFLQIQGGNVTSIEQIGFSCYNLNVNNCEILMVTERFMTEIFVKVHPSL